MISSFPMVLTLSPDGKLKGHSRAASEIAKFQEIRRDCVEQRKVCRLHVETRALFVR